MKFLVLILALFAAKSCHAQASAESCQAKYGKNVTGGVCLDIDKCTGGAFATSNCKNKDHICCVNETSSLIPSSEDQVLTRDLFLKLAGNTTRNNAIYPLFVDTMSKANISVYRDRNNDYPNVYRRAVFLSQLLSESDYFHKFESRVIDRDSDPSFGNNQTGDGTNYQGRGAILLRGRANYQLASLELNDALGFDLMLSPERVAFPSVAFHVAVWVWKNSFILKSKDEPQRGNLNELTDGTFHSFTQLTHSLTNNIQSLVDRAKLNDLILGELKYPSLKRGQGIDCELESEKGYAVPICLLDFNRPYCGCEGSYGKRTCPYSSDPATKNCPNSATVKCCVEKFRNTLDLVVLMDSSSSMTLKNFEKQKQFVNSLVKNVS
jgi:hypothetical protein